MPRHQAYNAHVSNINTHGSTRFVEHEGTFMSMVLYSPLLHTQTIFFFSFLFFSFFSFSFPPHILCLPRVNETATNCKLGLLDSTIGRTEFMNCPKNDNYTYDRSLVGNWVEGEKKRVSFLSALWLLFSSLWIGSLRKTAQTEKCPGVIYILQPFPIHLVYCIQPVLVAGACQLFFPSSSFLPPIPSVIPSPLIYIHT